ncbi:MAG: ABC transporter substrate-binding protein [Variovorax sp.]|nr:MAG: ABC transporter substrate-binding protein [Variovorax sp.]
MNPTRGQRANNAHRGASTFASAGGAPRGLRAASRQLLGLWLLACMSLAHAVDVVDERGITVRLAQSPQRIVTLLPSLTESVCALGACERLVGVDRYSNWPAPVRALPTVGGGIDPNVEAIVALKPDVVLLAKSSRVVDRLEALGLKVLVLEPKNHADVQRVLGKLGQVLGADDAQRVWRAIDASVSAAAQSLPASVKRTRVYFEVNNGPYAAGASSFMGETLTRLGAQNIIPPSLGPFPKINPEYVVRANPDLIMVGERSAQGMEQRPGWAAVRAVRDGRICRFAAAESDVLVRPGPRMGEAAQIMARCLREQAR